MGEFNSGYYYREGKKTTFERFKLMLRNAGFSQEFVDNFKIVLWDIPNNYYGNRTPKFEGLADAPNFFYMSGFDPAGIAFLTGKEIPETKKVISPKNAEELFLAAMSQELLQMLRV